MSDIKALWATLRAEADMETDSMMPLCVIRTMHAPTGYKAEICVKRFPIYHRLHEVKARALVWNETTGEVQYDTGQWVTKKGCEAKLKKAIAVLAQIVDYRVAMASKTKPVAEANGLF